MLRRPGSAPDVVLRYGPRDDQIADLRVPVAVPTALIVLLHGGFWRAEWDRIHTRSMADGLAAAGFVVVSPEYARTGGGGGWPTTFDDVALAVASLPGLVEKTIGRRDASRAVLVGHSAGGHLALWCASHRLPDAYQGVVALAPVADLAEAYRLDLDGGAVAALLGAIPDEAPDRYDLADPCRLPAPTVPVVVVHGAADVQVPPALSRRYASHAGAQLRVLPGVQHFELIDPRSVAWPVVLDVVGSFGRPAARPY